MLCYAQTATLRRGVDVIVGTPGRVIDHIERGNLDVSQLKYLVLDEADQMLDMGFKDDMEVRATVLPVGGQTMRSATHKFPPRHAQTIMSHIPALANCKTGAKKTPGTMQTLLFSATIPSWVREVSTKYMHEPHNIDLIGDANVKASKDVQHLMVQCPWQNKAATIGDLIKVYGGPTGRILVFCDTKREANEMVVHPAIKMDCQVRAPPFTVSLPRGTTVSDLLCPTTNRRPCTATSPSRSVRRRWRRSAQARSGA